MLFGVRVIRQGVSQYNGIEALHYRRVEQGSPRYDLRERCGTRGPLIWPADTFLSTENFVFILFLWMANV